MVREWCLPYITIEKLSRQDYTLPIISYQNVSHSESTIDQLHTHLAGRTVLRDIFLNFSDLCQTRA